MLATEPVTHIRLDAKGTAWIDETNVKVIEVVVDKQARGSTPEEMAREYPHLSLGQIYAALAYYHDHKEQLDAQIQKDLREVNTLREAAGEPPKAAQLRAMKRRA
jgi:uncharacterized protein (DUF433 family)